MKGSRPEQAVLSRDTDMSKTDETKRVIEGMVDGLNDHTIESERLQKRLNRRAAYAVTPGTGTNYDPHYLGEFAMHRAHIDAKQLDIVLVCPRTGKSLGRPWLTVVIAPKVRYILGYTLTFESPSANTTMVALRDVYKRMGALPTEIVMDNGKLAGMIRLQDCIQAGLL